MLTSHAESLARRIMNEHGLSEWSIEFTPAIEYLGKCIYDRKQLRFTYKMLELPDNEIEETIRHEVAHALAPGQGHGLAWRDKCETVGAKVTEGGAPNTRATTKGRAFTKLKEKCPECGRRAIQSKREIIYLHDEEIAVDVTDRTEHIPTSKTVVFGAPTPQAATEQLTKETKEPKEPEKPAFDVNALFAAALGGKKERRVVVFGAPSSNSVSEASTYKSDDLVGETDAHTEVTPSVQPDFPQSTSFTDPIRLWEDDGGRPAPTQKAIRITLQCGHSVLEALIDDGELDFSEFVSMDGKRPWSYQIQSVEFARDNNFNALFNLDMGLGKTIIMCMLLWKYKNLRPCLIVCNSTIVPQVCYELYRWSGIFAQRITSSKDVPAHDMFDVFVTTYDLVGKIAWPPGIQSIFLDECQKIKSQATNRTQKIIELIETQGIQHKLFMSNTPIKNNAGEYFVALNLLDKYQFPNRNWFVDDYCDTWYDGRFKKIGGIRKNRQDQFMDATKHFIIRFTRAEVQPDLPPVTVQNQFVEIDAKLRRAHDKAAEEFMDAYYAAEGEEDPIAAASIMQSSIFKLKHIVGLGKVQACVDYIETFLEENPGEKIVIFAHHLDVMELVFEGIKAKCEKLGVAPPMTLVGVKGEDRFDKINKFRDSDSCVLIAPTLSCGEGTNLQFAHWGMLLERQWNPANEIQVHGRFSRPGQQAKEVYMVMMIALDSTDQYLTEIVEQKFDYVSSALGDKIEVQWNERSVIQQLADKIMKKRKVA